MVDARLFDHRQDHRGGQHDHRYAVEKTAEDDKKHGQVPIVHNVNHRDRDKRLVDICFMLNIEDQHTVNYALKKLTAAGLVKRNKRGKEIYYSTTQSGKQACEKYRKIRERCLLSSLKSADRGDFEFGKTADLLRFISGLYDQAARASSSM